MISHNGEQYTAAVQKVTSPDVNAVTKNFYTYILRYPDGCFDDDSIDVSGVVFYVGKGKKKRAFSHRNEARSSCICKKCDVIRSVWKAGKDYSTKIIFQTDNEEEALQHEIKCITETYASLYLVNTKGNASGRQMRKQVLIEQAKREAQAFLKEAELLLPKFPQISDKARGILNSLAKEHGVPAEEILEQLILFAGEYDPHDF